MDKSGSLPLCAFIQHVDDDVLLVEVDQVALHVFVELVRVFVATQLAGPGFSPCSAELTGLKCLWNEVQNSLRDGNIFKELCHHHDGSMTPAYMKFVER